MIIACCQEFFWVAHEIFCHQKTKQFRSRVLEPGCKIADRVASYSIKWMCACCKNIDIKRNTFSLASNYSNEPVDFYRVYCILKFDISLL